MGWKLPRTTGALAGFVLSSFIIGIAAHSFAPFWRMPRGLWPLVFGAVFACCAAAYLAFQHGPRRVSMHVVFLATLASIGILIGMWRFDISPVPSLRRIDGKLFRIAGTPSNDVMRHLTRWRGIVSARIGSAVSRDDAVLITGILYGDAPFTKTERTAFVSSGLMHLVAVSGSNVTIVVQVLSFAMLGIGLSRRRAFYATSCTLLLFVGFVGFSASVVRAAFMGWLVLVAREIGRIVSPMRVLLVAASALLIIDPWQLVFDAGFALSFLAMWGILEWAPLIEQRVQFIPTRIEMRRTVAMTLAATLTTAPYLAWAFGQFTLFGLVSNILAAPLVLFVMGWGALAAAWGNFPGAEFVAMPTIGFVRTIRAIAGMAAYVPWLELEFASGNLSTCIGTYALLAYFRSLLSRKKDLSTENLGPTTFLQR